MNRSLASALSPDRRSRASVCAEVALVFVVFFLQGAWPVPDVNETVYLAHMKHAWDPTWAPSDLYLQSTDAHGVVSLTIGWLSRLVSLTAFAWLGRLLTWWLLAWSWRRLNDALVPRAWWSVISAGVFVCLQERCQLAGEWVIGGLEAKGFAYVLVFLALEQLVRDRWNAMFVLLGAAGAMHVLVGGWSAIAAALAWLLIGRDRPRLVHVAGGITVGLLLSLPGLWPALALNAGASAEQIGQANQIYVFERLPHHLAPQSFPEPAVLKTLLLWASFALLWLISPRELPWRRVAAFVLGSVVIAATGWLLSIATQANPPLYATLMRFYWFRLIDAVLPLGVALGIMHFIFWRSRLEPAVARTWLGVAAGIGLLHLTSYAIDRSFPTRPRADKENKVADYTAWRHICAWARRHTPADALFITPRAPQSFRWYSSRGEVVNYKDLPQDAVSMLQWRDRMNAIHGAPPDTVPPRKWLKSLTERTPEQLQALGQQFNAGYLLTDSTPPIALPCLYRNDSYAVYALQR